MSAHSVNAGSRGTAVRSPSPTQNPSQARAKNKGANASQPAFDSILTKVEQRADRFRTTPAKRMADVDMNQVPEGLVKAARGMESMFINEMTRAMRKNVPKNEMDLESPATDIYRGMLDTELAEQASRNGGVGLAEQIVAYMQSTQYNIPRDQRNLVGVQETQKERVKGTGGTSK